METSAPVQAVPRSVNLSYEKPAAVPAFTRRVESIATNAQSFTEGVFANIIIDTSTPGSFLDPTQSLLQFDLQINNTNPYIDYVNFPTCGAAALIQEFRIYCQGTPVEEILDYNLMFDMWMDLGGHAQEEFKLYVENSWRAPVTPGEPDMNFVKPPMVDRAGIIMHPTLLNQFGDGNPHSTHCENGCYQGLTADTTSYTTTNSKGTFVSGVNNGASAAANYNHPWSDTDLYWLGSTTPGSVRCQSWTNRLDNTYITWPSTLRPDIGTAKLFEEPIKKYRVQDYFSWLCNVKNIPVGVGPTKSFLKLDTAPDSDANESSSASWDFTTKTAQDTSLKAPTMSLTVCLPIFSGILGVWAEKMFPTMLIAPGSLYIQIKWAKASHAFQCTMDPCRRIFGTYRDYVPNPGLPTYYPTEQKGQVLTANKTAVVTTGTTNMFKAYTSAAARGADYSYGLLAPVLSTGGNLASKGTAATGDNAFGEGSSTGVSKPQYIFTSSVPSAYGGDPFLVDNTKIGTQVASAGNICVPERNGCFGTYLKASVPQVRRTTIQYNNAIGSKVPQAFTTPTYSIQNLRYVGQQIILPDEVTAGIVKMAVAGDISLHAQSMRTFRTVCSQSQSQSIILPIKVASATGLWVIFQNSIVTDNITYNSMSRICPFSCMTWNPDTSTNGAYVTGGSGGPLFVGSQTPPSFQFCSTSNNAFSIQLRIGNELVPQQPIQNIPGVIRELNRSIHAASDMSSSLPFIATPFARYSDNLGGSSATVVYNGLKNKDFCSVFTPVDAIDDQTIVGNPIYYRDYVGSSPNQFDRGKYIINTFLPLESKFIIGFDLETFPGQSDVARSGRYLGAGPLTLQMTNAVALNNSSIAGTSADSINCIALVLHDARWSIMSGGQIVEYY